MSGKDPLDRLLITAEQQRFWRGGYEFAMSIAEADTPHLERLGGYGQLVVVRGHILEERATSCKRCQMMKRLSSASPSTGKAK